MEANWNQARAGVAWGQAGIKCTETDQWPPATDGLLLNSDKLWIELDVTEAVKLWACDATLNQGLLLDGEAAAGVEYQLYSSEFRDATMRPQLIVDYAY